MLRHSSKRHGNCTNCNLGKCFQSRPVIENMSRLHAVAHTATPFQASRYLARHSFAPATTAKVITISAIATHETRRLKLSWSTSVV